MKIFDLAPGGRYIDVLDHLKVGDRIVFDEIDGSFIGGPATVTSLCIALDGLHIGMYDGDDGSAGTFVIHDGQPKKQHPPTPRPSEQERVRLHAKRCREIFGDGDMAGWVR